MPTGEHARPTDTPQGQASLGAWLLGCDTEVWEAGKRMLHVDKEGMGCYMEPTTRINSAAPIITCICREPRMVEIETGPLLRREHRRRGGKPDICPHVDQHWFDPARDAVHLHYTKYLEPDRGTVRNRAEGNPMCILYERSVRHRVPVSLTFSFIFDCPEDDEWLGSMASPADLPEISVCLKVVRIQIDEAPAIQSRLFGTPGEERVVLVDALDHEHISKFRMLWNAHRVYSDPLTEDFLTEFKIDDSEIIPIEEDGVDAAVREAAMERQVGWLLKRWREQMDTLGPIGEDAW